MFKKCWNWSMHKDSHHGGTNGFKLIMAVTGTIAALAVTLLLIGCIALLAIQIIDPGNCAVNSKCKDNQQTQNYNLNLNGEDK